MSHIRGFVDILLRALTIYSHTHIHTHTHKSTTTKSFLHLQPGLSGLSGPPGLSEDYIRRLLSKGYHIYIYIPRIRSKVKVWDVFSSVWISTWLGFKIFKFELFWFPPKPLFSLEEFVDVSWGRVGRILAKTRTEARESLWGLPTSREREKERE